MPALVKRRVRSPWGTRDDERTRRCPWLSKNCRNFSRISFPLGLMVVSVTSVCPLPVQSLIMAEALRQANCLRGCKMEKRSARPRRRVRCICQKSYNSGVLTPMGQTRMRQGFESPFSRVQKRRGLEGYGGTAGCDIYTTALKRIAHKQKQRPVMADAFNPRHLVARPPVRPRG